MMSTLLVEVVAPILKEPRLMEKISTLSLTKVRLEEPPTFSRMASSLAKTVCSKKTLQ